MQCVWFKRDLRIIDHAPLAEAAARGQPVLPLYIVEPELWAQPDAAGRHWGFIRESLVELRADLAALGQPLIIRIGAAVPVLEALRQETGFTKLWSHQETGNLWSYRRDLAVKGWCRATGIDWQERRQFGVVRGLTQRGGWARQWEFLMAEPQAAPPTRLPPTAIDPGPLPDWPYPGLATDPCQGRQTGGSAAARPSIIGIHRGWSSCTRSPAVGL